MFALFSVIQWILTTSYCLGGSCLILKFWRHPREKTRKMLIKGKWLKRCIVMACSSLRPIECSQALLFSFDLFATLVVCPSFPGASPVSWVYGHFSSFYQVSCQLTVYYNSLSMPILVPITGYILGSRQICCMVHLIYFVPALFLRFSSFFLSHLAIVSSLGFRVYFLIFTVCIQINTFSDGFLSETILDTTQM